MTIRASNELELYFFFPHPSEDLTKKNQNPRHTLGRKNKNKSVDIYRKRHLSKLFLSLICSWVGLTWDC